MPKPLRMPVIIYPATNGSNKSNLLNVTLVEKSNPKALIVLLLILLTVIIYLNGLFYLVESFLLYFALLWQFLGTTSYLNYPTRCIRTKNVNST